ncbi:hypothetical protein ACLK2I_22835 [Escherichia coli]
MGFAELFIDPVAIAQITRLKMSGVLTGIYMLATGAVANWLAGVVAQQTTSRKLAVWQLPLTSDSFFRWESGRWLVSRSSWYWPLLPVFCLARRRI